MNKSKDQIYQEVHLFINLAAIGTPLSIPEPQLIEQLKAKDKAAFDYLYDNYSGALMGIAMRILKNRDIAQEVVHDSFMKIWKSIGDFDADKGRLFTWMARICKNSALDRAKSKAYKGHLKTDAIADVVSEDDSRLSESWNMETIGVKDWLNMLDDEQRAVLTSVYFQGMSHAQAAEALGVPLGTVKTRLRLGLIRIRKELGLK